MIVYLMGALQRIDCAVQCPRGWDTKEVAGTAIITWNSIIRFLWKWNQFFRGQYFIAAKRTRFVHTRRGRVMRIGDCLAFIFPQYQCLSLTCSGWIAWVALGPGALYPQESPFVMTTGICVTCPGLCVWGMCCTLTLVCKHTEVWLSWAGSSQVPPLQGQGQLPKDCRALLNADSPRVSAQLWALKRCSHWRLWLWMHISFVIPWIFYSEQQWLCEGLPVLLAHPLSYNINHPSLSELINILIFHQYFINKKLPALQNQNVKGLFWLLSGTELGKVKKPLMPLGFLSDLAL